ncbi:MAG: hypothetical protein WC936_05950 [Candidatus Nanoarchaeia archaeon]
MKIGSYKLAMKRSFLNSTRKQEFIDNASGIMNVIIEDDDIGIDDVFALFKLRDELKAKFNGDVKT